MKRLTDNVNSRYVAALNKFYSGKKQRIVAYVESYDDIASFSYKFGKRKEICYKILFATVFIRKEYDSLCR